MSTVRSIVDFNSVDKYLMVDSLIPSTGRICLGTEVVTR